jgi:serine/threonine protein kinase
MQELIDKVLGRYKLVEFLSGGPDGLRYRGVQVGLEREVAVRVLTPELAKDARVLTRFRQESRATAQLSHPHILTVYDSGKAEGLRFAVTELLDPDSLADRIRGGPVPVREVVRIGVELSQALEYIHQRDILHAQLFPSKVRFDRRGATILAGFGVEDIERIAGVAEENAHAYCPPELLLGETVDPRSDVYQLGAVLYEACTGRRPYPGRPPFVSGGSGYEKDIVPVKKLCKDAPESLDELLLACLRADPRERPQDAGKLRHGLGRAMRKLEVQAVSRQVNKRSSAAVPTVDSAPTRSLDQRAVAATAGISSSGNSTLAMITGGHGDLADRETQIRLALVTLPIVLVLALAGLFASGILGSSPPQILEVVHRTQARSLEVSWRTDRPGHGALEARPEGSGEPWARLETSGPPAARHKLKLAGLEPGTRYEYRLVTGDAPGAVGGTAGPPRRADTTEALEVNDVQVADRTHDTIVVTWKTNVPSLARLRYWRTGDSRQTKEAPEGRATTRHRMVLTELHPDSSYRVEPIAVDPSGEGGEVSGAPRSVRTRPAPRGQDRSAGSLDVHVAKLRRLSPMALAKLERSLTGGGEADRRLDPEEKVLLAMTETLDAAGFTRRLGLALAWVAQLESDGVPRPSPPAWSPQDTFRGALESLEAAFQNSSETTARGRLDQCLRALAAVEGVDLGGR